MTHSEYRILKNQLDKVGRLIHSNRVQYPISKLSNIDRIVPSSSGVYWIQTDMPTDTLLQAIVKTTKKNKKIRKNPPSGVELIEQMHSGLYTVYSGTEANLNKRLKQHLFNLDSPSTAKLGCIINRKPFSEYEWRISFTEIDSYELRYAIESWWRLNIGWPKFCIR